MDAASRLSRILVIAGLVAMVLGAIDPLEGSLVILPGSGLVAIGARLGRSPQRVLLYWSLVLVGVGVGALWGVSGRGGLGGASGGSNWWWLLLLPYPVGWIMGLVGGVRKLRDDSRGSVPSSVR